MSSPSKPPASLRSGRNDPVAAVVVAIVVLVAIVAVSDWSPPALSLVPPALLDLPQSQVVIVAEDLPLFRRHPETSSPASPLENDSQRSLRSWTSSAPASGMHSLSLLADVTRI